MPLGPDKPAGLAGTRGAAPGAKLKSTVYDEFGANNRTIGLMLYARTHAAGRPGRSAAGISAGRLALSETVGLCSVPVGTSTTLTCLRRAETPADEALRAQS